ncbi:MAG TPA: RraA family protein [Amaricoccus sp.]|uniref:RraA family protein n=1 Tax=Amaricoccus sp. TaxID=1872485 RepID=UPI002C3777BC|nr:RraA family protein [Amaricoccus sp.]HRO11021.1 RraA family protein [Amaricoccus sp.]
MGVVVHGAEVAAVPAALMARWRAIPVPVAVDLAPERQIDPLVRALLPAGQQADLFGRAVTARCLPPDFGAVLEGVGRIGRGEVLVIDAGGSREVAVIGDVLGGELARKGVAGLVCDGAVRDTGNLARMAGLPVYARWVNPRGPVGAAAGEVNGTVTVGGCEVAPGDLVIGDADGLVALPPAMLAELIEAAEAKLALEAEWTARLRAGEPIGAIFGLP